MSFELREYQSQAIDALLGGWDKGGQRLAVVLPTGAGKGHPLDTEVPTPQGLRRWGDLGKGDQVFGSNGYPTTVTEIYDRGVQNIYRVTLSDGSTVETDEDHLWSVRDMKYRRTGREQRTLSTRELHNEPKKLKRGYRFRIPMAGIVQRERAELPIDPYTLGAMLANGSTVNGALQLTTPDDEVVKRIRRFHKVTKINDTTPGVCPRYWLPELRQPIAELGLDVYSEEKFIPRQYLEASASQRLALLQGLMDGDGSTRADSGRRSALYHSTAQGLLEGVRELVTSLGGNASVSWSKRPDGKDCGTVRLLLPSGIHPFFTRRKGAEPQGPRQLQPRRAVVSVELVRQDVSRCITVAAQDSLYLITRDHIATHNTVVFSHLVRELRRTRRIARVLVLAHREELLEQAADKIHKVSPHLRVGIVKGSRNDHDNAHVVVASVQTMAYRRPCRNQRVDEDGNPMGRCNQCSRCSILPRAEQIKGIQAIIVDEAHHAAAPSYKRVLRHYGGFDEGGIPVAGFTATMTRDKGGLAKVWEDVVYTRDIADMISDGFLVKPHAKQVVVPGMDLDQAKKTSGDFTAKSLAQLMLDADAMSEIAKAYQEYASDRPGIVFCPTVEVAHAMTEAFVGVGIPTTTVWGDMPDEERKQALADFKSGKVQVLSNVMVLTEGFDEPKASCLVVARPTLNPGLYCLDEKTEVLTNQGWKGADDSLLGTRLAAFDLTDSSVHWSDVLGYVNRPLDLGETMYGITSPTADIRVSDKHRMVWKPRAADSKWRVSEARTLAERRSGYVFPIAGIQEAPGVPLTDDELRFIGWFMSDGTINQKTNAITIFQAEHQPWNADIVAMLEGCGFKYRVYRAEQDTKFNRSSTGLRYTVSRGAPRGEGKQLRGWGDLEYYLSKDLAPTLDDMTKRQLAVLLHALHLGDGRKSQGKDWTSQSYHISTGNKLMADRLQSLCVRRGFKCNVSEHSYNTNPLYELHIKDTMHKSVGGSGQLDRENFREVPHVVGERVWCVETDAGTIITRRNGKVAVVGNCQMAGRVLRPAPEAGKTDALILDVTGVTTRHRLASIVDLTGKAKKTKNSYMEDEDEEEETEPTITAETETGMEMQKELLVIGGWKDIDLFAATSDVRWVTSKKGYPFIVAGGRGYFLVPGIAPGTYHARVIIDGVASKPPKDPAVPSLAQAREELERIARAKAGDWDNKDAPWRKRKPSDKQAALARKMGIDVTPDMKAGQVSDAIAARKVSRFVDAEVARHEESLAKLRGRTTT